jgi:choline dehydrogenase-like flavoprotein
MARRQSEIAGAARVFCVRYTRRLCAGGTVTRHAGAIIARCTSPSAFAIHPGNAVHLLGTGRMGNDPKTSVVDKYHRAHDVKNLFIVDGSSFVTSGRGQPTMTIQALAFRAADHIAAFARRGEI